MTNVTYMHNKTVICYLKKVIFFIVSTKGVKKIGKLISKIYRVANYIYIV